MGNGPYGSSLIDPAIGGPQADIFYHYKQALRLATASDRAIRAEEKRAKKMKHSIDPERIEKLTEIPFKVTIQGKRHPLPLLCGLLLQPKKAGLGRTDGKGRTFGLPGQLP